MKRTTNQYAWSHRTRAGYVTRRSTALGRLLVDLAVSKRNQASRQATFDRLCEYMLNAGGVYTKFLQGVLLGIPEVQHWVKEYQVDFFENVPQEPLNAGEILRQELGDGVARLRLWPDVLASGTFAQVYSGLLDLKQPVVIKIQRRTIRPSLKHDVWLLRKFARFGKPFLTTLDADVQSISRDFGRLTLAEMDYEREADMAEAIRTEMAQAHPDIVIPRTYYELSTEHVLVQDRIGGVSVAELLHSGIPLDEQQKHAMTHAMSTILLMPFTTGYVYADPHPGNLRLLEDGRVALLDFGAVDERPIDVRIYLRLLEAVIKATEGSITAAEALDVYFATYAPRLHSALEVVARSFGLPPLLQMFAKMSIGVEEATRPMGSYQGDLRALADINHIVNPDNRFMLRTNLQSVSYARATHTLVQAMRLLGLETEIVRALKDTLAYARQHIAEAGQFHDEKISLVEAKEIVYNWLERVMERNPILAGDLRRQFDKLQHADRDTADNGVADNTASSFQGML